MTHNIQYMASKAGGLVAFSCIPGFTLLRYSLLQEFTILEAFSLASLFLRLPEKKKFFSAELVQEGNYV